MTEYTFREAASVLEMKMLVLSGDIIRYEVPYRVENDTVYFAEEDLIKYLGYKPKKALKPVEELKPVDGVKRVKKKEPVEVTGEVAPIPQVEPLEAKVVTPDEEEVEKKAEPFKPEEKEEEVTPEWVDKAKLYFTRKYESISQRYGDGKIEAVVSTLSACMSDKEAKRLLRSDNTENILKLENGDRAMYFTNLLFAREKIKSIYEPSNIPGEYDIARSPQNFLPDNIDDLVGYLESGTAPRLAERRDKYRDIKNAFKSWDGTIKPHHKAVLKSYGLEYIPKGRNPHPKIRLIDNHKRSVDIAGSPGGKRSGRRTIVKVIRRLLEEE